jgi:glutaredoxin
VSVENFTIWSKDKCVQCNEAKALLKQKGYTYEERNIDQSYTREQFFEANPNAKSFPQVWLDNTLIGGYSALVAYLKEKA